MIRSIITALMLVAAQLAIAANDGRFSVEIIKEIEMPKEQIYDNTLLWMAETFVSSEDVIDLQNREMGKIVGNAITVIDGGWLGDTTFRYSLKVDIKDQKFRATYSNVLLVSSDMAEKPVESANRKMLYPKATKRFEELTDSLYAYLLSAENNDDW